jgi:NADPH:quinone reductase-like Zn-dependent oxidoreductase
MKAIVLYEAGGIDKLIYQEVEKPTLKPGEVLVKTKAIGINPADAYARRTEDMITRFVGPERPAIIGWDISGEIVEKAADTDGYHIGDSVFTFTAYGKAYAEYVAVPVATLAHKPKNVTYEEAAVVPLAALTGCQPVMHLANIKKGDRILIHAGSGGVGHYAIQLAKYLGAYVITTCSGKNRDFVLSLGADEHIDYTTQVFDKVIGNVNFVLDTVGDSLKRSIDIVKQGGSVVTVCPPYFNAALVEKAKQKGVTLSLWMVRVNRDDLSVLAGLMSKGLFKSHISAVFPFSNMAEAHTLVEGRRTVGKIVVNGISD